MIITEEFKQYLAGFFDGDGCIKVEKLSNSYTLRISFSQSNIEMISSIERRYPYLKSSGGSYRRENSKCEFCLRAAGKYKYGF